MSEALGILETTGFTPAIVALDAMEKAAGVRVWQLEKNDFYGIIVKLVGPVDAVEVAIRAGKEIAAAMGGKPIASVLPRPDERAWPALESKVEVSPLIQQATVILPRPEPSATERKRAMADKPSALGLIETQGFTAVFEAIDSACKAANVEVVGKEKLGGGYITVVIKGDVAAVKAAVDAGKAKVEGLGKLIAAHVIPRPSDNVLGLLPK
jgi:microcompartment protein CcmL/EutN